MGGKVDLRMGVVVSGECRQGLTRKEFAMVFGS